jgi:Uma2 family endonuclease
MSVVDAPKTASTRNGEPRFPQPKKWTGAEYDQLVELGTFARQRVELIQGEVLQMSPMDDEHVKAVVRAQYALLRVFPPSQSTVLVQCALQLGEDARPEPDVSVIDCAPMLVTGRPQSAVLVVEVSDSTLDFDREQKAPLYARHGIAEYWIVNLVGRCLEVHRNPIRNASDPRYAEVRILQPNETVAPLAAPQAKIVVSDLLP